MGRPSERVLIAGSCWLPDQDRAWLAHQWVRLAQLFDIGTPMLLVDCLSPEPVPTHPLLTTIQIGENIGHLTVGGRDGWGRAAMTAFQYAIDQDFEWVAYWDADVLFLRSALELIFRMKVRGLVAAGALATPYPWQEGIYLFYVPWMKQRNVIGRYNWEGAPRSNIPNAEQRMEAAIGPDYALLGLEGLRDDAGVVQVDNLKTVFPRGCDWLTHSSRPVYEALLVQEGLAEG